VARTKVSFATCNLYNLNLPGLSIYTDSDGWDQSIYDRKVAWAAGVITTMSADVWGFQELWHHQALEEVFAQVRLPVSYRLLIPDSHQGKIVCAGAVREDLLVGEPEWIENFPSKFILRSGGGDQQTSSISVDIDAFSRPLLHFQIRPRSKGKIISVYVAHLKSKTATKVFRESWYREDSDYYGNHSEAFGEALSTIRRTAEATALRMLLTDAMKHNDNPVVVLGDLNDNQQSNTLKIITGTPNYLLSGYSVGGSDIDLYTVGNLQQYRSQRDVYYTHIYQNIHESLDHILVSQEFYDNSTKRIWAFRGMELLNDHLNRDDHKESGTTDHGVVRAEFEYRPY
jgi:endonuclease/exonuclease/phosphatase family metal-dependent hydrolase